MQKKLLLIILILIPYYAMAAVYQQTISNGTVIYSDVPLDTNAKKINITTENKISTPNTHKEADIKADTKNEFVIPTKKPYTVFTITTPADQATIQNQPSIPVVIDIKPDLQPGDKIQLYIDGKPWGEAIASNQLQLIEIDRGTHQLSASIIDSQQQLLLQSNTITFYNHRASVNSIKANKANSSD